eukprot:TRINITY_DN4648_c0_g1_i1.p1 TRINITY_DN4648_c0_g1~~TRINITY_DN4648_c0_g1_i1.p1  ORF type:complete len:953 (-),score=209.70 TRINITY_DN4648_c0_g1_i1:346-3105(-)
MVAMVATTEAEPLEEEVVSTFVYPAPTECKQFVSSNSGSGCASELISEGGQTSTNRLLSFRGRAGSVGSGEGSHAHGGKDGKDGKGHTVLAPQTGMFADSHKMKERLREQLATKRYDVTDYYHRTGNVQAVAKSLYFEYATLSVIALNALWIAIDVDYNDADTLMDAHPMFIIGENAFCIYFVSELVIRFLAFAQKRHCCGDAWFVFDTMLVVVMVVETWLLPVTMALTGAQLASSAGDASVLRLMRLLRLTRMARMARLLRSMPELLILIRGMVAAFRSVFFTLCLLTSIIYMFGIFFAQITMGLDIKAEYFATVGMSMHTLLVHGVMTDNISIVVHRVGEESWLVLVMFYLFVLLAAFTVMNMLIGVLCEVVSAVAATEKEEITVNYTKAKLEELLHAMNTPVDSNGDMQISKDKFNSILESPEACKALQEVDVDVVGLVDLGDFFFAQKEEEEDEDDSEAEANDSTTLSFAEFMDLVLQLRGCNTATVKDLVNIRKFVHKDNEVTRNHLAYLEERLTNQATRQHQGRTGSNARASVKSFQRSRSMNAFDFRKNSKEADSGRKGSKERLKPTSASAMSDGEKLSRQGSLKLSSPGMVQPLVLPGAVPSTPVYPVAPGTAGNKCVAYGGVSTLEPLPERCQHNVLLKPPPCSATGVDRPNSLSSDSTRASDQQQDAGGCSGGASVLELEAAFELRDDSLPRTLLTQTAWLESVLRAGQRELQLWSETLGREGGQAAFQADGRSRSVSPDRLKEEPSIEDVPLSPVSSKSAKDVAPLAGMMPLLQDDWALVAAVEGKLASSLAVLQSLLAGQDDSIDCCPKTAAATLATAPLGCGVSRHHSDPQEHAVREEDDVSAVVHLQSSVTKGLAALERLQRKTGHRQRRRARERDVNGAANGGTLRAEAQKAVPHGEPPSLTPL